MMKPQTTKELEAIRDQVLALSLPARLAIAAELIQRGKPVHALAIVQTVADALTLAKLQGRG